MRTWTAVVLAALAAGCAAPASDDVAASEDALGADPHAAGIAEGTPEEEGTLIYVNDRSVGQAALTAAGVPDDVASAIVSARGQGASSHWFASLDEVDALPGTDDAVFGKLLAGAKAAGLVEAPGFDPPTSARLSVPDHLGHVPTTNDVTVEAGFDGKSPEEVRATVRSRLTNTVHPQNERFTNDTIVTTHKAFTIAVGNFWATGSSPARFARILHPDELVVLGTMSAVNPVIVRAVKGGVTTYYAHSPDGGYAPIPPPKYPVIMRARVSQNPPGVRVFYPAWSAKVLSAPTSTVIEGGHP